MLIATHDLEQARAWDLVLCLNRRQVAFGHPSETLTATCSRPPTAGRSSRSPARTAASASCPRTTTTTSDSQDAGPASIGSFLGDPLADPLVRRAALEVALIGVAGGALGCWIVHYGLPYAAGVGRPLHASRAGRSRRWRASR